jgi:hypothetical protein
MLAVEGLAEGEELASNILHLPSAGMATTAVAKPAVAQLCPRTSSAALDGIAQERAHVYRSYI